MLLNEYHFKNQTFLGLHQAIKERERELSQGHHQAPDTGLPSSDFGRCGHRGVCHMKGSAAAFKHLLQISVPGEEAKHGYQPGPTLRRKTLCFPSGFELCVYLLCWKVHRHLCCAFST